MALEFKVRSLGSDLKRFVGLITDREHAIKKAPEKDVDPVFAINENAKADAVRGDVPADQFLRVFLLFDLEGVICSLYEGP